MSTRLHHAFELRLADPSLGGIHAWAQAQRERLLPEAGTILARWVVSRAVEQRDRAALQGQCSKGGLVEAFQALWAAQTEAKIQRKPDMDVGVKVCLFVDPVTSALHGLFFIENTALQERFLADPAVVPTPYWNHVAPDPSLSAADWEARGMLWKTLLGLRGIPTDQGMTLTLVADDLSPAMDRKVLAPYLPSWDQRVTARTREVQVDELNLATQAAGEPFRMSRFIDRLLDQGFNTPSEPFLSQVRAVLDPALTIEDLL